MNNPFSQLRTPPPEGADPTEVLKYLEQLLAAFADAPTVDSKALGERLEAALETYADSEPGSETDAAFEQELHAIELDVYALAQREIGKLRDLLKNQRGAVAKKSPESKLISQAEEIYELYDEAIGIYLLARRDGDEKGQEISQELFQRAAEQSDHFNKAISSLRGA